MTTDLPKKPWETTLDKIGNFAYLLNQPPHCREWQKTESTMSNATDTTASTLSIDDLSPEQMAQLMAKIAGNKDLRKKQAETQKINAANKKKARKDFLHTKMVECAIEKTVAHSLQVAERPSANVVILGFNIEGFSGSLNISVPNGKLKGKALAAKVEDAISLALGIMEATAEVYSASEESEEETTETTETTEE